MCKLVVKSCIFSVFFFFIFTVFVNSRVLLFVLSLGVTVGPACCTAAWVDVEV